MVYNRLNIGSFYFTHLVSYTVYRISQQNNITISEKCLEEDDKWESITNGRGTRISDVVRTKTKRCEVFHILSNGPGTLSSDVVLMKIK